MRSVIIAVLSCSLIFLSVSASGQETKLIVSGKVEDEEGHALPGTDVIFKNLNLGGSADMNGVYRLMVPDRYLTGRKIEIQASLTGYFSISEKIVLSPGSITIDFKMTRDFFERDVCVSTGMAEPAPMKTIPFTVSRISGEMIEMAPSGQASASLQGKVTGATVIRGSGKPGDGVSVRLRSAANITGNNMPLVIVDGVYLGLSDVDVDALDIESIEVVKGPAGAVLYGSLGANGVIHVKTGRGNNLGLGETRIRLRNEIGFNRFVKKKYRSESHGYQVSEIDGELQFVDDTGQPVDYRAAVDDDDAGYIIHDNPYPGTLYNHLNMVFDPGEYLSSTMSISQHKPGVRYTLSLGNFHDGGIVSLLDGYHRQHVRLNLGHKVRPGLNLMVSTYFSKSSRDLPPTKDNPFYTLMFMNPNADLRTDYPDLDPHMTPLYNNPLFLLDYAKLKQNTNRLTGSFRLNWTPSIWFSMEGRLGYNRGVGLNTKYDPKGITYPPGHGCPTDFYQRCHWSNEALNAGIMASFYKSFRDWTIKLNLSAMAESNDFEETDAIGYRSAVDNVPNLAVYQDMKFIDSYQSSIRALSYAAVLDLDWRQKYILNLSWLFEGNSLFGENKRFHSFYRAAGSWRLSEEPFWFTDKIQEFRIRYACGTAGIRPPFAARYNEYSLPDKDGNVSKINMSNDYLKPAYSIEQEIALEMTFLNRFYFELVYADAITKDQILRVTLPAVYGYEYQWQNAGTLKGRSIEAELKTTILTGSGIRWSAGLRFDRYTQNITEFLDISYSYGITNVNPFLYRANSVLGAMYGIMFIKKKSDLPENYDPGLFDRNDQGYLVPVGSSYTWKDGIAQNLWGTTVNVAHAGHTPVFLDWGLPVQWMDHENGVNWRKIGDVIPDFSLGFNTTFQWKGLTLYMLIHAQIGGEIYNWTRHFMYREFRHADCDQAGKKEYEKKPVTYYKRLYAFNSVNNHFVEDASYAKLREVSLRYSFDRTVLSKIPGGFLTRFFNRVTVGITGRNLLTLTHYPGFDPEVGFEDATLLRIDAFGYPQYQTLTGMIELEF